MQLRDHHPNTPRDMRRPSANQEAKFFEKDGALFIEIHNGNPSETSWVGKMQPGYRTQFEKAYAEYKAAGGTL